MSGKGDSPRPFSVTPEEFAASHERIFGKRPARTPYVPPHLPDTAATWKTGESNGTD